MLLLYRKRLLRNFASSFQQPMPPLAPRPALMLAGVVTSSGACCLVIQTSHEVDIEVFKRWVVEGDAVAAIASVRRAKKHSAERVEINSTIVFGTLTKSVNESLTVFGM